MASIIQNVIGWLHQSMGLSPALQVKLFTSVFAIVALWALRLLVVRLASRGRDDPRVLYRLRKSSAYIATFLGFLIVGRAWFEGIDSLSTFLGLLSAGLAIALRDPIVNLAGWAFILWRKPFEVGDRVEIGGQAGDVIDQRIFQFTLMEVGNWVDADQSTGRVIHIPNGRVFTEAQANYTKGFEHIWDEVPVLVTFESDWKAAKQILQDALSEHAEHISEQASERIRRAARRFMIFYRYLGPIVYTSVAESGVLLTMRYLVGARQRRDTREAIWEHVLEAFAQRDDIDFAYPTTRFYDNRSEGKPGATPEGGR